MNVAQQRWQQHKCWVPARQLFQRLGDVPTEGIPFMGLGGFGDGRMHQGGIIRSQNKDEQLTNQEKVECHMAFAPYSYSFWSSGVGRPAPSLKWPKCWIFWSSAFERGRGGWAAVGTCCFMVILDGFLSLQERSGVGNLVRNIGKNQKKNTKPIVYRSPVRFIISWGYLKEWLFRAPPVVFLRVPI